MIARIRAAGLVWPTLMTIVGLAILVSLGTWQMNRKTWKDSLVERIAARIAAAPRPLAAVVDGGTAAGDIEYARVEARGRYRHDGEQFLYAPHPKLGPGFHVVTPLQLEVPAGAPSRVVLVNRGWVPEALRDPARRPAGQVTGAVAVTGLVRLQGEHGAFTPGNDPGKNLWYWRDIPALAKAAAPADAGSVLPVTIDAEAEPANPGGWPKGGTTEIKLPNRHLEYALTWYGLAAAMLAVFGVYAWGRLTSPRPAQRERHIR